MIVVDASAVLELLLGTARGSAVAAHLTTTTEPIAAPHVVDLEVAQVLRRLQAAGVISVPRARQALEDHRSLGWLRFDHAALLDRIWELRKNLTAYDAAYVALAEASSSPLLTCDAKLASAPGHSATVVLVR